jgi:hypothetical protein
VVSILERLRAEAAKLDATVNGAFPDPAVIAKNQGSHPRKVGVLRTPRQVCEDE